MFSLQNLPQEQALLTVKALINDTSEATKTALNTICKDLIDSNTHLEIVKILIQDKRVDPSTNDNWAIRSASLNGYLEIVKILMQDKRVDPSARDNCAIRYASRNGHSEIVKILMQDKRVDPSADDNYAIMWASQCNHPETVKILMQDKRVDPSAESNFAIIYASQNGHLEIVKILMQDERVDPSASSNRAIIYASQNDHLEIVKILIPKIDLGKITDDKILNLAKYINDRDNEKAIFEELNTEIDALKPQIEILTNTVATEKSQTTTEKKSKEDVLKEIIKTMNEYNIHKICIDGSNITLKFVV